MLPIINNPSNKSKEYIIGFLGLNYGEGAKVGEFAETKNLTVSNYPILTQRPSKAIFKQLTAPTALYARGKLCYVDGTTFYYYDETSGAFVSKGTVTVGAKQFATVNTKIVIWPDKVYYDTSKDTMAPLALSLIRPVTFAQNSTLNTTTVTTSGNAFMFIAGDAVKVTGCTSVTANNSITAIIRSISTDGLTLTFDSGVFTAGSEAAAVFSREIPDMDYICEWNNRLWGCGGGKVYASALGDPTNFNVFDGISTDSYAVAVGSDGDFTGCIGYSTHILFMKEHCCHKFYGTKPANYEMSPGNFQGVMGGSSKSTVIINEVLFYLSRQGVVAYAGSVPYSVSDVFGNKRFKNAVACSDDVRYYISMQDANNVWGLYVYDTLKKLWIHEDATHAYDMAFFEGHIYTLNAADKTIYIDNSGNESVEWSAELCKFTETIMNAKSYSRLTLRAELEAGSYILVETSADNKPWQKVKTIRSTGNKIFVVPIIPTYCDNFRIRLSGKGRSKIYALTRDFYVGGNLK